MLCNFNDYFVRHADVSLLSTLFRSSVGFGIIQLNGNISQVVKCRRIYMQRRLWVVFDRLHDASLQTRTFTIVIDWSVD